MEYKVSELYIYPIKSLGGIRVDAAQTIDQGFLLDRNWMLLDQNNEFVTQRENADLALFITCIENGFIHVSFHDNHFKFDIHESTNKKIITKVWDDDAITMEVSTLANEWFSDQLGQSIKLVKIKDKQSRMHHSSQLNANIPVSLADGYPFLVVGTESLAFLNSKLETAIEMNRFRPNIIIHTTIPHEEDQWQNYSIGSLDFTNVKPCGRCQIITIDQQTTFKNNEPLKILNQYRKAGNNVMFGMNAICNNHGIIQEGDTVFIGNN